MPSRPSRRGSNQEQQLLLMLRDSALIEAQLDVVLRPWHLTVDRWRALMFVNDNPGASMADLIEALVMPSTTATRVIDALVEMGLAFRTPDPTDRRRVSVQLSAPGKRALLAARDAVNSMALPEALAQPL